MDSCVNEFSVMLIDISYNDALNDARNVVDELEKDLKRLGYMDAGSFIKFHIEEFILGEKTEVTVFDKVQKNIDWEIKISIPTLNMEKSDALKIAEITRFQIERICKEFKFLIFQTINPKELGYVKFDQCRIMLDDEEDKFSEMTI